LTLVKLNGKYFEALISLETLENRIAEMSAVISREYDGREIYLVVVLSGAFRFAAQLLRDIRVPAEVGFVKLKSYSGMKPGEITTELALPGLAGKHVIIAEDIIDTGNTVAHILKLPALQQAASVKVATMLHKPDALLHKLHVDYLGFSIPDRFVVGYGLDYDGKGRELNGIYQLTEN
jgi:hypoxanthine phosphoribosyltransferase